MGATTDAGPIEVGGESTTREERCTPSGTERVSSRVLPPSSRCARESEAGRGKIGMGMVGCVWGESGGGLVT